MCGMTRETTELLKKALELSVEERAELAGTLIESLEAKGDPSVEATWDEEVARRMEQLDSGTLKSVSFEEARRKLRSALE